jgi:general stress protein 26
MLVPRLAKDTAQTWRNRHALPLHSSTMIRTFLLATLLAGVDSSPQPRHLIYLHGRIVQEQQSARPKHPSHGYYELEQIAAAFRKRGFVVSAEVRPKDTTVGAGADRVVEQVRALLQSGVPTDHITVVGASMGASIALRAAARLREPDLRFAFISPCASTNIPAVTREEGAAPLGQLLFVREESDISTKECPSLPEVREIVVNTGLAHGFLYRPLPEWLEPVVQLATTDPAKLLAVAREMMTSIRYCAAITVDAEGRPQARTVDPFPPDESMTVWFATNAKSRKVAQIRRDARITLHYFDPARPELGYVTLLGRARLVDDEAAKRKWWKAEWEPVWPDRDKNHLPVQVVPERIEVVSPKNGIEGDALHWTPPAVDFARQR